MKAKTRTVKTYPLRDKKEKDAKEAKAERKTKKENAAVKSNINGKNGLDLDDKGKGLQLSGPKVKQPKSEQGSGKKDLESYSEKSPLIPNAQKKQYTLEVGDIPEKDATGGNGVGVSYSNPAFTGPTRKSSNGKVDAKQKKELDALKEDFFELLDSNEDITTSTEWKAAEEVVKEDPRYKRVSKTDDEMAKLWYKEYIDEKQKKDFLSLLEEKARKIKEWERAKWKIDHDPRYVVVEYTKREKWFQEYRWRKCIFNRIKWSSNVRSVNFVCFMTLAVLYCLFVTCFYCVWSSDIQ
ncbi:uncharacterized protein LOC128551302 [Mercenaria mercenaria]|uniref:uncharacterized protein LOC128551302 n=1 Tax=Mercenaria mercenaria TaxID=6596 RepID=UPI00234F4B38|nr:uncharacterized protein LOC128551302 [Mercenaria mercenaria]